jgi:hypothetical protein
MPDHPDKAAWLTLAGLATAAKQAVPTLGGTGAALLAAASASPSSSNMRSPAPDFVRS